MNPAKKKGGRGPGEGEKSAHKKLLKQVDVGTGKTK